MQLVTPLPVEAGLLLEHGHPPTLILKSTWIPGDEWARIAPVQLPLTRPVAHPDGVHLYYPGDFVPARRRLDLVLAGLRSDGRSTPIVVSVDDWYRRFRSVEPDGAEIAEAAMHTPEGEVFTRLVPVNAPAARYRSRRWQFVDAALSLPLRRMPRSVRVEDHRGAVTWSFSEMLHASIGTGATDPRPLEMSCDTIFVEPSTRTLVLVHRVELPARLPAHVVVAFGPEAAPPPTARGRIGLAIAEYEISSVEAAPYRPLSGWTLPASMRDETARLDSKRTFDDELPFARDGERRPATVMSRPRFDPNATVPAAAVPEMIAQAMPFRAAQRAPAQPAAVAPPPRVPPPQAAQQPQPIEPPSAPPPAYPPPPPAERASSPHLAGDPRAGAAFVPAAPPLAPPAASTPPTAPPAAPSGSMSLDEYARVRARLVAGSTLDDALASLGLAPAAYTALDRSVAQELAREAKAGRSDLAARLKQLVRKAGDGVA